MTRREAREAEQRQAAADESAAAAAEAAAAAAAAAAAPEPAAPEPRAAVPAATAPPLFEAVIADPMGVDPVGEEPARPSRAERRAVTSDPFEPATPKRKGAWGCLIALLVVAALGAGAYIFLQGPINAVIERFTPAADFSGSGTGELVFMIHEGDTGSSVAENLVDEGVTASYDAFYDLLLEQSPEPEFHPGAYQLAEEMSAQAALDALQDPANKLENTFVIPEGTSLPDALVAISEGSDVPLESLQAAAVEPPASYGLPAEATTLEGFLFPATYTLEPGLDAHSALQTLVNRQFEALDAAGVPVDQRWRTIVLASIVQREAGSNLSDFPKVARVFQNRLDQGINLESDATVAYGTGNTHTVWTTDEERADPSNLYNTYANPGLPVGPIGNPGDVAIDAAIHPADGPWLFFVPVNLATGETVFTSTVEEHEAAVAQLQEWCAQDENASYCE
ncbi:endolytic transglycosylase MltG [Agromyces badenianii]|uniref:endolytic transglycosylase MltG n=1 Tax=Agromyces badenianii TaxID=2080742 RepID=UPI000D599DCA|nr:endolytic transglycosylase MltG [Agromyces badenianii]PWC04058.1 endolytic transglycosylase MltG [Agromyces badenianii]